MWLLITAKEFAFGFRANEIGVLPSARRLVEPTWLPHDWYLQSDASYRHAFNLVLGTLIRWLGFVHAAYVGRLLAYAVVASALYSLFRTLRLRPWIGVLVLLLFLSNQGLVAGEWIVGGVETKTVAYACAIFSLSAFLRERYLLGFAVAGASISFHVLVGMYALFCALFAIVLNGPWRSQWRLSARRSWPLLVTGYFGWQTAGTQLVGQSDGRAQAAWNIYVLYRNPHHLVPSAWEGYGWIVLLSLATCLFAVVYALGRSRNAAFVAAYALGSVVLFLCGLGLYAAGEIAYLRFYWFRFPDVVVPLLTAILIGAAANACAAGRARVPLLASGHQAAVRRMLRRGGPVLMSVATVLTLGQAVHRLEKKHAQSLENTRAEHAIRPVLEWISEHTPEEAVFLVDPSVAEFYVHAQRAMFVAFKHVPRSVTDILEWHKRIVLCNGNRPTAARGFEALHELKENFYRLDEAAIRRLACEYGLDYYVGLADGTPSGVRVHSSGAYAVYELDCPDRDRARRSRGAQEGAHRRAADLASARREAVRMSGPWHTRAKPNDRSRCRRVDSKVREPFGAS